MDCIPLRRGLSLLFAVALVGCGGAEDEPSLDADQGPADAMVEDVVEMADAAVFIDVALPDPDAALDAGALADLGFEPDGGIDDPWAALPDTPAARQMRWVLDIITNGVPEIDAVAARFHESFLSVVPPEQTHAFLTGLALALETPTLRAVSTDFGPDEIFVVLAFGAVEMRLWLRSVPEEGDLIAGLLATEVPPWPRGLLEAPVADGVRWILTALNASTLPLDDDALRGRFSVRFIEAVPPDALRATLREWALTMAPLRVARVAEAATPTAAEVILSGRDGRWYTLSVAVAAAAPNVIEGMRLRVTPEAAPNQPPDWDALDGQLAALAQSTHFMAAELTDAGCVSIAERDADVALGVASAFKLYVLSELGRQVAEGERAWADLLAIREAWKSLPSGIMQNEAAGTEFALSFYALRMISISDNTATDHLVHTVGRRNVEDAFVRAGHSDPAANVPLLTTRELFLLKWGMPEAQTEAFLAMGPEDRRAYLDLEVSQLSLDTIQVTPAPRFIDAVEWFATPPDLCQVMLTLRGQAEQAGASTLLDILSANPGADVPPDVWPFVGYKGGSEFGVLNLTWLLQRRDGRWFFLVLGLNDTEDVFSAFPAQVLAHAAFTFLAEHP